MSDKVEPISADTFEELGVGEDLCSIAEISPDVICDEQTEKLFDLLPAKDIINGFNDGGVSTGSPVEKVKDGQISTDASHNPSNELKDVNAVKKGFELAKDEDSKDTQRVPMECKSDSGQLDSVESKISKKKVGKSVEKTNHLQDKGTENSSGKANRTEQSDASQSHPGKLKQTVGDENTDRTTESKRQKEESFMTDQHKDGLQSKSDTSVKTVEKHNNDENSNSSSDSDSSDSDSSSSGSSSSSSSSSSSGSSCSCSDCVDRRNDGGSQKPLSPVKQETKSDMILKYLHQTKPCLVRLTRYHWKRDACFTLRQLPKLLSKTDLASYRRRGRKPKSSTQKENNSSMKNKSKQPASKQPPSKQSTKNSKSSRAPSVRSSSSLSSSFKSAPFVDSGDSSDDEPLTKIDSKLQVNKSALGSKRRSISTASLCSDFSSSSEPLDVFQMNRNLKPSNSASGKQKQSETIPSIENETDIKKIVDEVKIAANEKNSGRSSTDKTKVSKVGEQKVLKKKRRLLSDSSAADSKSDASLPRERDASNSSAQTNSTDGKTVSSSQEGSKTSATSNIPSQKKDNPEEVVAKPESHPEEDNHSRSVTGDCESSDAASSLAASSSPNDSAKKAEEPSSRLSTTSIASTNHTTMLSNAQSPLRESDQQTSKSQTSPKLSQNQNKDPPTQKPFTADTIKVQGHPPAGEGDTHVDATVTTSVEGSKSSDPKSDAIRKSTAEVKTSNKSQLLLSGSLSALLKHYPKCQVRLIDCIKYPNVQQRELRVEQQKVERERKEKRKKEKREREKVATEEEAVSSKKRRKNEIEDDENDSVQPTHGKDEGNGGRSNSSVKVETKQPYLDPWSQAITTCNISKIPKKKSKVLANTRTLTATPTVTAPPENPTERLLQVQHALKTNLMSSSRLDKDIESSRRESSSYNSSVKRANKPYVKPYSNDTQSNINKPSYRGWHGQGGNPYNERLKTANKPAGKPVNPYDDPDRIMRRDQRRRDFLHKNSITTSIMEKPSFVDDAPPDTFMGDDSPYDQNKRGPRTPDLVRDPLGLSEHIPAKVENRFSSRREEVRKPDPRFSTGEEMSASLGKMADGVDRQGFLEEQRMAIKAMAKGNQSNTSRQQKMPADPFNAVNQKPSEAFNAVGDSGPELFTSYDSHGVREDNFSNQQDTRQPAEQKNMFSPDGSAGAKAEEFDRLMLEEELKKLQEEKEMLRKKEEELARLKALSQQPQQVNQTQQKAIVDQKDGGKPKKPVITPTGFGAAAVTDSSPQAPDPPIPGGVGFGTKQTVIDEIARLSLEISKQIAVATGVPETKVAKEDKHLKKSSNPVFEKRKAKIKELIGSEPPQPVPPPPSHSPPPLPPTANFPPPPMAPPPVEPPPPPHNPSYDESTGYCPPPLPLSPPRPPAPPLATEKCPHTEGFMRNRDRYPPVNSRPSDDVWQLKEQATPAKPAFKPLAPPPPPPSALPLSKKSHSRQPAAPRHNTYDAYPSKPARPNAPSTVPGEPLTEEELAMQAMGLPTHFSHKPIERDTPTNNSATQRHGRNVGVNQREEKQMLEREYEEGEILDSPPKLHHSKGNVPVRQETRRRFDGYRYANDAVNEPTHTLEEWLAKDSSSLGTNQMNRPMVHAQPIAMNDLDFDAALHSHGRRSKGGSRHRVANNSKPIKVTVTCAPSTNGSAQGETKVTALPFTMRQISMISERISNKNSGSRVPVMEYKKHLSTIRNNSSSLEVYTALTNILHIHETCPQVDSIATDSGSALPHLNETFNKVLFNLHTHQDFYHLKELARTAQKFQITLHPRLSAILLQTGQDY